MIVKGPSPSATSVSAPAEPVEETVAEEVSEPPKPAKLTEYQQQMQRDLFVTQMTDHRKFEYSMEHRKQMISSMSNIVSSMHEARKATIQNLKT